MKNVLDRYKFDGVWHFTDRSNLESIVEQKALLSLGTAVSRGIEIAAPGGNDWSHDADRRKGLHDFVHLAFVDDHPMLFVAKRDERIQDPVWLKIDSSVILEEGVLFCTDVSNKSGVDSMSADEAVKVLDFEVLFTYTDWRDPSIQARRQAAIKSEILVPDLIPIDKILGYKNG